MGKGGGEKGNTWEKHPNLNAEIFILHVFLKLPCPRMGCRWWSKPPFPTAPALLPVPECLFPVHATGHSCKCPQGGPSSSALCTGRVPSQRPQWCRGCAARAVPMGLLEHSACGRAVWEWHCTCLSCGVGSAARPKAWGSARLAGCSGW